MLTISGIRVSGGLCIALLALSGCSRFAAENGPLPSSNATSVEYGAFGPSRPSSSGFGAGGAVISGGSTGVFGTTDQITVDDSGPFPSDTTTFNSDLADFSSDDQRLLQGIDIGTESALVSAISFPGDDGSPAFFDADIGPEVYFATNSSSLSDVARETLRKQAAWLNVHPNVIATVEGHADERGTREYNLALGERRASAVRGYFTALGIAGDRIRKISYGKERPSVTGSNEAAWRQNRRAVTVLEPNQQLVSGLAEDQTLLGPAPFETSVDSLLNDPILNDLPSGDPLLNDPLLNDPLLNDPLLNDI